MASDDSDSPKIALITGITGQVSVDVYIILVCLGIHYKMAEYQFTNSLAGQL